MWDWVRFAFFVFGADLADDLAEKWHIVSRVHFECTLGQARGVLEWSARHWRFSSVGVEGKGRRASAKKVELCVTGFHGPWALNEE